jgi:hypothetical protein
MWDTQAYQSQTTNPASLRDKAKTSQSSQFKLSEYPRVLKAVIQEIPNAFAAVIAFHIIGVIKLKSMKWALNVASVREKRTVYMVSVWSQAIHRPDVDGMKIIKWILRNMDRRARTGFMWFRIETSEHFILYSIPKNRFFLYSSALHTHYPKTTCYTKKYT